MTTQRNNNPEGAAIRLTSLWQTFGPNTYPIELDQLVQSVCDIAQYSGDLTVVRKRLDSIEGSLIKTRGDAKWTILLNSSICNKRRQRFTFAHEIGHFMCHRDLKDEFSDGEASLNNFTEHLELEANTFASWLLMPANLMREEFESQKWTTETLCQIGSRFECSLQASALRYVKLSERPVAFVVSRDGMIIWCCKAKNAPFLTAYKFGDELPQDSIAKRSTHENGVLLGPEQSGPSWNEYQSCRESQYFDYSGKGYQYTCIEFTG